MQECVYKIDNVNNVTLKTTVTIWW